MHNSSHRRVHALSWMRCSIDIWFHKWCSFQCCCSCFCCSSYFLLCRQLSIPLGPGEKVKQKRCILSLFVPLSLCVSMSLSFVCLYVSIFSLSLCHSLFSVSLSLSLSLSFPLFPSLSQFLTIYYLCFFSSIFSRRRKGILDKILLSGFQSSTKMEALMQVIRLADFQMRLIQAKHFYSSPMFIVIHYLIIIPLLLCL